MTITITALDRSPRWRPDRIERDVLGVSESEMSSQRALGADVLDTHIRTKKALDEVRAASPSICRRWGIVTGLRPSDFATALRSARV